MGKIWIIFFLVCNSGIQLASAVHLHSPKDVMVEKDAPHPACGVIKKKEQDVKGCPSDGLGIIDGMEAKRHAWPWQVYLEIPTVDKKHKSICGGSLINMNWVVTAAHCEVSTSSHLFLGLHNRIEDRKEKETQKIQIGEVINHPNYAHSAYNDPLYDITLIRLERPVLINKYVSPVCVADTSDVFDGGMECVTTGWGDTIYKDPDPPRTLQQVCVPLVTMHQCQQIYPSETADLRITSEMICAGGAGTATCVGDSGGPLVCKKNGAWTLVGVTSWAKRGCHTNTPGVYARITALRAWMYQAMAAN